MIHVLKLCLIMILQSISWLVHYNLERRKIKDRIFLLSIPRRAQEKLISFNDMQNKVFPNHSLYMSKSKCK